MTFDRRFGNLARFLICILLIFSKNLLQDFLYQNWNVSGWQSIQNGFFYAVFETFDWLIFWYYFRKSLDKQWKIILMFIVTVVFTTVPDFIVNPILRFDYNNLFVKSLLYFVPFIIFLLLKRSLSQIFLPFLMAIIPLVDLEIGNGFKGNLSFLNIFLNWDLLVINLGNSIFVDIGLATLKTIFWASFAILFFEVNHQFYAFKSWRLHVEMPLKKRYLLLVFIVFKTMIYFLLGSLIITLLGKNSLPLFTNKVGILLNGIGFLGYLTICTLYYRKYMTMYFYDKCGHSNWLYPFFFLPFVDIIALAIFIVLSPRNIKRFFQVNYNKERLVSLICIILVGYAAYELFTKILKLPNAQSSLRNALLVAQVFIPLLGAIGVVLSLKSKVAYRTLLTTLFLLLPVFYFYIIPNIENSLKIEQLVGIVSAYMNISLSVAFLYPVLNFYSFLKLDKTVES